MLVIAIDYDGTITDGTVVDAPKVNIPRQAVIDKVKEFRKHANCELILWTCREGKFLQDAVDLCLGWGIKFDAVNSNSPSQVEYMRMRLENGDMFSHRKIFANLYVDDRSPGSIEYFLAADVEAICKNFNY